MHKFIIPIPFVPFSDLLIDIFYFLNEHAYCITIDRI